MLIGFGFILSYGFFVGWGKVMFWSGLVICWFGIGSNGVFVFLLLSELIEFKLGVCEICKGLLLLLIRMIESLGVCFVWCFFFCICFFVSFSVGRSDWCSVFLSFDESLL